MLKRDSDKVYTVEWAKRVIATNTRELCSQEFLENRPEVSVLIHTYQHVRFLNECIEGVLSQKTSFPFEIVIGDDGSEDGSVAILEAYQARYPSKIRVLVSKTNFIKLCERGRLNLFRSYFATRGKYIAFVEGDDYWITNDKLQRQYDYMESNLTAMGCFHDSVIVNEHGVPQESIFKSAMPYASSYTQRDCLTKLLSRYASASLFFRREEVVENLPHYYREAGSDYLLDLVITENGTLDYLPELPGCCYRIHEAGVWSKLDTLGQISTLMQRTAALMADPVMRRRYGELLSHRQFAYFNNLYGKIRVNRKGSVIGNWFELRRRVGFLGVSRCLIWLARIHLFECVYWARAIAFRFRKSVLG